MTPSARDEDAYTFAVIAIGHVLLGAALVAVLTLLGAPKELGVVAAPAWLAVAVLYWWIKERRDLKRGGSWLDGIVDAGFVGVGATYGGPAWWPLAVFALVGLTTTLRAWTRPA